MTEKAGFESWAIVEIMGHKKLAGRVVEEQIGGTNMLRVDVPPVDARESAYGQKLPARPAYTQYYGASAIFSITPCTEETARNAADRFRDYPVELVSALESSPRRRIETDRVLDDDEEEWDWP